MQCADADDLWLISEAGKVEAAVTVFDAGLECVWGGRDSRGAMISSPLFQQFFDVTIKV
jgi:hypothetical protein